MKLTLGKAAELMEATTTPGLDAAAVAEGYSIDSRTLKRGELFFAIQGDRFDGHDFALAALDAGAAGAVVRSDRATLLATQLATQLANKSANQLAEHLADSTRLLLVADTVAALQQLGACVRRMWGKPLVAVTGSAGKTTTKEAIAHLLGARFRVLKSEGNLNNHFGLPLQLLRLEPEHEVAVVEMGMSHAGEIAALARLAQPNIGVVTNVAPVHLEFFDSVASIARAKYELIESLTAGSCAVLNADDEYVSQFGREFHGRVITYGIRHPADVRAEHVQATPGGGSDFDLVADSCRERVHLALLGEHNVYNALAAAAVALDRGLAPSDVARRLATLAPAEKRGEVLKVAGATVINDCYNSNPRALQSMVESLVAIPAERHIVVAGEMLELGAAGAELHRASGEHMAGAGVDVLLGVRGLAAEIVTAARAGGVQAEFAESPEAAAAWLARLVKPGDAVLLKASRGVRLERALDGWRKLVGLTN